MRLAHRPPLRITPLRVRQTAQPPRAAARAASARADVAVIGGGIAGCSAALHLARRGYKVALLEARLVGYGARAAAADRRFSGSPPGQKSLVAQVGRENARRLFDMSVEALDLTQSLIRDHGIDCDYRPNHVHVATKPRHLQELREWEYELHDEYGYESARLARSQRARRRTCAATATWAD